MRGARCPAGLGPPARRVSEADSTPAEWLGNRVGGIYYKANTQSVEYLFIGLYDDAGRLNYVGRCGIGEHGDEISQLLRPLMGGSGFTGDMPGGKSRWSGRERKPVPLEPKLVAEVGADHIEYGRFRHGSRLIRWRDDKEPTACKMDQINR